MAEQGVRMSPNDIRKTALAILSADIPLTRNAGSFLGQLVATGQALTDRQEEWLDALPIFPGARLGEVAA
jgi:hypothetical protein